MRRRFESTIDTSVNKIVIDQLNNDPFSRVSGDINGDVIQYIRNNSHRVLAKKTGEGEVAYCRLDDSNSNLYYDGSAAILDGSQGDVFVKLPKFYYKGTEGDIINIFFSRKKLDSNYIEWNGNILIGAYETFVEQWDDYYVLRSISGVTSTGNKTHDEFNAYSVNRGPGYQIVDWQMHCVLGCLYYAMYGNTNSQAEIGAGTSIYYKETGQTDNLGMEDTKASTNGNKQSINFWGLENWWGNKSECIKDYINPMNSYTAKVDDPVNGGSRNLSIPSSGYLGYYPKKMKFGRYCDLVATNDDPRDGSKLIGYTDNQWFPESKQSNPRVLFRSFSGSDSRGGIVYASGYDSKYFSTTTMGSRLAFRGALTEILDVEFFKSIPVV